jgi:hypothetical protein
MPEDTAVQHVQQTCEAVLWLKLIDIIFTIQGKRICRNWFFFRLGRDVALILFPSLRRLKCNDRLGGP